MIRLTLDSALEQRNVSRYELAKRTGIQYQIIDKYYKNKVIRYDSYILDKICTALKCDLTEIIEYTKESL
ncbi:MAG: helix-turn-helix transcriptional regulator [Clostridia bacterium]|nr:helix-turn-helix transcriptional regulator [Clostridia bacterium]